MSRRRVFTTCVVGLTMSACAVADVTPPSEAEPPYLVVAESPAVVSGVVGADVALPPAVRVTKSSASAAGVTVRFAVTAGGGSVADTIVLTDHFGRASCGSWTLGQAPGDNEVVVTVEHGASNVSFLGRALARSPNGLERYELFTVGGHYLPLTYSAGDLVGGEYALVDDSTFSWGYDVRSGGGTQSSRSTGTYLRTATAILFYFDGRYFSQATVTGDTMNVVYADVVDFDPEVYVRLPQRPPPASSASAPPLRAHP